MGRWIWRDVFRRAGDCAYHFPLHYEEILRNLLVKAVMTEVPDLNGAEGKRIFDKAQLSCFFCI